MVITQRGLKKFLTGLTGFAGFFRFLDNSNAGVSCAPFPLTPTLSPRRGGASACPHSDCYRFDSVRADVAPSPWGEGRGEGERDRHQKRTS